MSRPSEQLVERDRQIAHALSGGVVNGIGNSRGRARDADLADALDADRIDVGVARAQAAARSPAR